MDGGRYGCSHCYLVISAAAARNPPPPLWHAGTHSLSSGWPSSPCSRPRCPGSVKVGRSGVWHIHERLGVLHELFVWHSFLFCIFRIRHPMQFHPFLDLLALPRPFRSGFVLPEFSFRRPFPLALVPFAPSHPLLDAFHTLIHEYTALMFFRLFHHRHPVSSCASVPDVLSYFALQ
jgi:hypothetical protein